MAGAVGSSVGSSKPSVLPALVGDFLVDTISRWLVEEQATTSRWMVGRAERSCGTFLASFLCPWSGETEMGVDGSWGASAENGQVLPRLAEQPNPALSPLGSFLLWPAQVHRCAKCNQDMDLQNEPISHYGILRLFFPEVPTFYGPKKAPTARPGASSRFYAELFPSEQGSSSRHFTAIFLKEMGLKFSFDHKCRERPHGLKLMGFFEEMALGWSRGSTAEHLELGCDCRALAPGS